ncbi:hypothetical protein HELRODRAFT_152911, partial [Helobdella robusta]|uniref:Sm domain-containing protein n=1 Tax=Helobdella robusta TaxID=6412 RepID=T1EKY1_HELRO
LIMSPALSSRDKIDRSLVSLIRGINGRKTTVELRNEKKAFGTLESVDHNMNIHMSDVTLTDIFGSETVFDKFFVRGTNIRYVQIPSDVSITEILHQQELIIKK